MEDGSGYQGFQNFTTPLKKEVGVTPLGLPDGSAVKNSPVMQETQETQVPSLGQENTLEAMTTHSNNLAWEIPWTEEPGGPQFMRSPRVGHDLASKHQKVS